MNRRRDARTPVRRVRWTSQRAARTHGHDPWGRKIEIAAHGNRPRRSDRGEGDTGNGYAAPVPTGRYRIHRSEGHAPATWWLEHIGTTTPRRAHALVRTPNRGWTLALLAPFTGWSEPDEASIEIATLEAQTEQRSIEIYTAGRRLYRLDPGSEEGRCTLVRRTDKSLAIRPHR